MVSLCTRWILLATTPGIGKRATVTAIPMNALQPRMLYKNQTHITTCRGKYITMGEKDQQKGESRGRDGGRRDDKQRSKISRPETRFSRSVETRLFIFPTKLLEAPSSSSLLLSDLEASSFRLPLVLIAVDVDCSLGVS